MRTRITEEFVEGLVTELKKLVRKRDTALHDYRVSSQEIIHIEGILRGRGISLENEGSPSEEKNNDVELFKLPKSGRRRRSSKPSPVTDAVLETVRSLKKETFFRKDITDTLKIRGIAHTRSGVDFVLRGLIKDNMVDRVERGEYKFLGQKK